MSQSILNGSTLTINASNGVLDGSGNNVFTATALSFVNGATLVINGSASQFVVINSILTPIFPVPLPSRADYA